ncbi:MAG: tyrosine-type recombinase/integrase [Chitinophagaceae bacterium]|nr:tyrosine-type recombinase/integrase [Chitinophagaceae bacterium]
MNVPFHSLLQDFIDYLRFEKRYSAHTVRSYQDDLTQYFDYCTISYGSIAIKDLTSATVRSWLASLKNAGLSSRSINRKLSSLKSFFKFEIRSGIINATPMTGIISPKAGKRLPVFVAENDLAELLRTMKFSEDWKGLNAKMLLSLFYSTGMRLSELIGLKETQIDKSKKQIKILGKGNKERIVPISAELVRSIDEYKAEKKKKFDTQEACLLVTEKGNKLYSKYAYLLTNQYLQNIKTLEKKSPHILRHTFATHLTNHGASLAAVKELLGHSSLASTQIYTHNSIEKLKDVYKKAHPRASEK